MSEQGFAERLTAALDRKGRSYTNVQFARELSAALKGSGRTVANSTVTEWLKGRSEPPLYVIEAIGRVLAVLPAWLAFGEPAASEQPAAEGRVIPHSAYRPAEPESAQRGAEEPAARRRRGNGGR